MAAESGTPLLAWTGHPLADVGIAALCAIATKADPAELTLEDLDRCAAYMEKVYFGGSLGAYLTCVFMNSEYVQPGEGDAKAAKRRQYARRYLFAHRAPPVPGNRPRRCRLHLR